MRIRCLCIDPLDLYVNVYLQDGFKLVIASWTDFWTCYVKGSVESAAQSSAPGASSGGRRPAADLQTA
jgi:hypothetical protein